jgi:hypothetical protein
MAARRKEWSTVSITALVVLIVVILLAVLVAAAVWSAMRRRNLQRRFGPEYDRLVAEQDDRGAAERELRQRESRHAKLDIRPLEPAEKARYTQEWTGLQAGFVEDPRRAVSSADDFITRVMTERGYPTGDFDERTSTLSVEHSRTLGHYRLAHDISLANQRGQASTEQLRQALVHYRALAGDLLGDDKAARSADTTDTEKEDLR